jgi:F420-dependent oxidoreductase-like protein
VSFGITTPQHHVAYEELGSAWKVAEELGYDSAWLFDHFLPIAGDVTGPCLEGMVALTALALKAPRLRAGMLVLGNTYRHPAVVANMAATLDIVTGGRLEMGVGAAWYGEEHAGYGIPFPPLGRRIRMMAESLQIMKALWTEGRVNFQGRYYTLTDAMCEPKPVQVPHHPPLWVGGAGERLTLRIVAEHADGWDSMASVDQYRHKVGVLADHCRAVGREPDSVRKAIHFVLGIDRDRRRAEEKGLDQFLRFGGSPEEADQAAVIGTPDECVAILSQYAALGVSHFIIEMRPPYDYDALELFAREVIPAFH